MGEKGEGRREKGEGKDGGIRDRDRDRDKDWGSRLGFISRRREGGEERENRVGTCTCKVGT